MTTEQAPNTTETPVEKHQHKQSVEHEFVKSDRVELVEQANKFVSHMIDKQVLPIMLHGSLVHVPELTPEEDATYRSALGYLRRQFDVGHSDSQTVKKSVEEEVQVELQ